MPTYADVYCAGFINRETLPDANFVAGGLQTPQTTKFVKERRRLFEGTGYSFGAEYEIIRALRDINEYEMYPGQSKTDEGYGAALRGSRPRSNHRYPQQDRRGAGRIRL